jgi:hypothetical protein
MEQKAQLVRLFSDEQKFSEGHRRATLIPMFYLLTKKGIFSCLNRQVLET